MEITLLENNDEIRRKFNDRFVLSWEEFQIKHNDSAYHLGIDCFEKLYLWDRFYLGFTTVSFFSALSALKEHTESVLIMSEDNIYHPGELFYNNKKYTNFVARVNANELASLIEEEWNLGFSEPNDVLPLDLYVFDESMKWFIAFTHETSYIDSYRNSRHCILYAEE